MESAFDREITFKRIRPRINVESEFTSEELHRRFKQKLSEEANQIDGKNIPNFLTIYPPEEEQHYWSPQLTITIEPSDNGSLIRGLYGPNPTVWTLFIFFYTCIGFAIIILLMTAASYAMLDKDVSFLWWVPILVLLFLSIYGAAYQGQRFGQKQMGRLHRFVEETLEKPIELI